MTINNAIEGIGIMKLTEVAVETISSAEAKNLLLTYVSEVRKVDFNMLMPVLEKHFPNAIYTGEMYRAVDFDVDKGLPNLQRGRYSSWAKDLDGLESSIDDLWADSWATLAIYVQTARGIEVNKILGNSHDHFYENEVIAQVSNYELDSFIVGGADRRYYAAETGLELLRAERDQWEDE